MATTIASISLTSTDLLSSALAFTQTNALTTAGTATGLTKTSGLARTNFTVGGTTPFQGKTIFRSDDATAGGANKIYLKNLSTNALEFFTVFIDQEEMGRLYSGDWAFFPWSATAGTKETFRVCITAPWVVGDELHFDGVETKAANTVVNDIAAQVHAQNYPNWTTAVSTNYVTFTARHSIDRGTVAIATADMEIIQSSAGAATAVVDNAALGTATESDIIVVPSVATTMDLEHILFHE